MNHLCVFISFFVVIFAQDTSRNCPGCKDIFSPVCGSDGNSYKSLCLMNHQGCMTDSEIEFACNGNCPCASSNTVRNVIKIDRKTIEKLQNDDSAFHLDGLTGANEGDILEFEILEDKDEEAPANEIRNARIIGWDQFYQKRSGKCPSEEISELPARLIDWFHVLKMNKRVKQMKEEGIEDEDIIAKTSFMTAKVKAMYSQLACSPQENDDAEKLVCLRPVQWMFYELDSDKDNSLSVKELTEIEHIHNENCIKPFLDSCDVNQNGEVTLKEFCSCLCVAPPCSKAIQNVPTTIFMGKPQPMGKFAPTCDEDGFFMPKQCNTMKECWCVDRNGAELKGSRGTETVQCEGVTMKPLSTDQLVPLDMVEENK